MSVISVFRWFQSNNGVCWGLPLLQFESDNRQKSRGVILTQRRGDPLTKIAASEPELRMYLYCRIRARWSVQSRHSVVGVPDRVRV